eukprot:CAMPEP_0117604180 /NCGR_PEP_ID=MMETSP0784-20121206/78547_1 /TAXON_ID=39447 /ORGANISM="" /LENGTH=67 /DNA_ID=CAMNT_0005407189 /DNA_START=14 /DNA_END=217 /DNA_ORIENTATION=-
MKRLHSFLTHRERSCDSGTHLSVPAATSAVGLTDIPDASRELLVSLRASLAAKAREVHAPVLVAALA